VEKEKLIEMLNRDLTDEHSAILRYLIHAYLEGEDTPLGAGLLSRSREEMWHMHWLGMVIGSLGGEPDLVPAVYPYDHTNRATIFKSYVDYEEELVPHYKEESEQVEDPHIRRVLERESWESAYHARKFQRVLDKLKPEDADGLPEGEKELPDTFLERLQVEVASKYTEMLQHVRHAWVFQKNELVGWQLMDQAMEKMKQLAHFSEDVAENGIEPRFELSSIDQSRAVGLALKKALEDVRTAHERHLGLKDDEEFKKHEGLMVNLDLTLKQEAYEAAELEDWVKKG